MVLFTNSHGGFRAENTIVDCIAENIDQQNSKLSGTFQSENVDKIFNLCNFPYKFSKMNVLSELKVK